MTNQMTPDQQAKQAIAAARVTISEITPRLVEMAKAFGEVAQATSGMFDFYNDMSGKKRAWFLREMRRLDRA